MKRGLIAAFVLTILMSFAFVSACTGGNDQLIMRLSDSTNAHASLWNTSTYATEICYDNIFKENYDIRTDPTPAITDIHECTNLNKMLFLNKLNNSHVSSEWDFEIYNKEVCYGNLQCFFEEGTGDDCSTGLLTARMFRPENSHMETADSENYGIKVCCSNIYMTNTNYEIINRANVRDTVYFISPPGFSHIEISRDGFWIFDSDVDEITSYYDSERMTNIISWEVPNSVVRGTETDLIIKITGENGEKLETSEFGVTVTSSKEDDPLELTLHGVECGDNFTQGQSIDMGVTASDADDILEGKVYVNGEVLEGSEFENGETSFTYKADTLGEIKIEVNATNSKGLSASYIANIMVYNLSVDANYTAACIASPTNFQDFEDTDVLFDASTSRGIIVKNGEVYGLKPATHPFIFHWEFEGGNPMQGGVSKGVHNSDTTITDYWKDPIYYLFTTNYPEAGTKKANLRVELPDIAWDYI